MKRKFTQLEEEFIQHYQARYDLRLGWLRWWLDGFRNRSDALVNIEGTNGQRMNQLKREAKRRHDVRMSLGEGV